LTDIDKTFALIEAAEARQRDEARSRAKATQEPVTPEQRHEEFARELATRLHSVQSDWVTFS
jgi:hypothetical protein